MENKLIKTDNYLLLVDDSEIKDGDWMHRNDEQPTFVTPNFWWDFKDRYRKIIAHLPLNNSTILEGVPLLPPLEYEDDVEKLANEYAVNDFDDYAYCGFISGYNKARERYKYTEEDIWKAFDMGKANKLALELNEEMILSLSQPKIPIGFDVDYPFVAVQGKNVIKTTTNSQGQTVWVGKYIY